MLNNIFNVCVGTSFKVIQRKTLFVYFEGCVLYCASVAVCVCVCVCVRAYMRACVCVLGGGGAGVDYFSSSCFTAIRINDTSCHVVETSDRVIAYPE